MMFQWEVLVFWIKNHIRESSAQEDSIVLTEQPQFVVL